MRGDVNHLLIRGDALRLPLPDRSVNLTFGSPPYRKARLYLEDGRNLGIARDTEDWIDWMLAVTDEALRVTDGPVLWVAAGSTEDRNYHPICEGFMYRWWQRGGHAYRPCYWHRRGIPGSGQDDWFRGDAEYVMCFRRPGKLPWSDNTAMGHAPKWAPGGEMSHRLSDGARVNQWGGRETSGRGRRVDGTRQEPGRPSHASVRRNRRPDGTIQYYGYEPPNLANPGNVIATNVGHGHMGHPIAHENEAPFPEDLAEFFVRSLCPPGGTCMDPFSGSGTTVSVADRLGRRGIGLDLRMSQCRLGKQRLERPHAPVARAARDEPMPLFDPTEAR